MDVTPFVAFSMTFPRYILSSQNESKLYKHIIYITLSIQAILPKNKPFSCALIPRHQRGTFKIPTMSDITNHT